MCDGQALAYPLAAALQTVVGVLADPRINWALTGSLAHRLQGVPVSVCDIDVQTDEESAWSADMMLADCVTVPARWRTSDRMRSIFGQYRVSGVEVEVMGAVSKRVALDDPWGPVTNPADHRR